MADKQYYPGSYYQPLFDHISEQYGVTLLESQMADIIHVVNQMQALHPSESADVNVMGWVTDRKPGTPGDYYCRCKIDGEPKRLVIELDKNLRWGEAPFDRYADFEIVAWFDESPTAAGDGKEKWDSIRMIGRVQERFKELERYGWNWKSFYNGWIEGRSDMFCQIKDIGQYSSTGNGKVEKDFATWLAENTEIIREEKITLYRYCNKMNEWGNYTLEDIYTEYKQ